MLSILKPGIQTSLQARPREGWRHYGIPDAGPADAVSMALANRLVGNPSTAPALEVTLGGLSAEFQAPAQIALTGAVGGVFLSGAEVALHTTLNVIAGMRLDILAPGKGMRAYLAVAGGFCGEVRFGSVSTYMPAALGGFSGRALQSGDVLRWHSGVPPVPALSTPDALRLNLSTSHALRACPASETHLLKAASERKLFREGFTAARQMTRMGFALEGARLHVASDGTLPSAAVYPGTVQCPPSGTPYILGCDAQTTGGYPRIAQVARCDRHLLGQIRPGDRVQFLHRTPDQAVEDYRQKAALLGDWLGDFIL